MAEMPDPIPGGSGRKPRGTGVGASSVTARRESDCGDSERLMEAVVERGNMTAAYKRVIGNKGSAGVDGMGVDELRAYLDEHWERIKSELLEDRYKPQAVRAVEIGKPDGGVRQLGIPTVVDRLIGQALHQVLEPVFDPGFSESSYGFRRGRSAQQAVEQARKYVAEGYKLGRRYRPGEVLRPCQPRYTDVADRPAGKGQAGTALDPEILASGDHDGRSGSSPSGRHPARQPTLAPVVEHNARRSG